MMAPESERAKCPRCGSTERATRHLLEPPGSDFYLGKGIPCENAWHEPTLTCSDVVERLAECLFLADNDGVVSATLDRSKATAILHSWRERRVQELPILEKFEDEIALHGGFGLTIDQLENLRAALVSAIGKANYPRQSAEWREQIRKGAKHD